MRRPYVDIESIAIVGTGRAARTLGLWIAQSSLDLVGVGGRDSRRVAAVAAELGTRAVPLERVGRLADLTLIVVSDEAIGSVARDIVTAGNLEGRLLVHCAGGLGVDILQTTRDAGARVGKAHPLCALSGRAQDLTGIVWGIDADDAVRAGLLRVVGRLGGMGLDLREVDVTRYHTAAVMASNLVVALLSSSWEVWESSGAGMEPGKALLPLVRSTLENVEALGPVRALTGPVVRGDAAAVTRQLESATAVGQLTAGIYRDLSRQALRVTAAARQLDPVTARALADVLCAGKDEC